MAVTHTALFTRLASFLRNDRGNVGITFAVSALPLMAMVGAGIDYGSLTNTRTSLKVATDAAALALTAVATTSTQDQLNTAALNYVTAGAPNNMQSLTVSATYNTTTSRVSVTASATIATKIMNAFAIPTLTTSATSTAEFGSSRLRVALALDNTGSMDDDGKMPALRTATKNLLDKLQKAGSASGDVYVSMIPFNRDVNIGNSNYSQSWIDWTTWDANNGTCKNSSGSYKSYYSKSSCTSRGYLWYPDSHSSWNGCIMDRTQNYDTLATAPVSGTTDSYFPADDYGSCPLQMVGLNNNFTNMKAMADSMYPTGNTNQGIGFVWAWQSLVGGGPFSVPAEDPKYQYDHVIILMSDGMNTQNRWYSSSTSIDNRQKLACDNAKAAGVTIYTIQVNTGGDPDSDVLEYCASPGGKFTILTAADQIVSKFNDIGTGLNKVRIVD